MNTNWENGCVAILDKDNKPNGTGFVISDKGIIVTCPHLLQWGSENTVSIRFKATNQEVQATIIQEWSRSSDKEDVAFLQLPIPLPPEVQVLQLISGQPIIGRRFHCWGYPKAKEFSGLGGEGHIVAQVNQNNHTRLQLSSAQIVRGYSGGPLWDSYRQGVIGLINLGVTTNQAPIATPSETIVQLCPELTLVSLLKMPFPLNESFVGRKSDLEQLHGELEQKYQVGLIGLVGIGKTELAVAYAYHYQGYYPGGIFWLDGTKDLSLEFAKLGNWLLSYIDNSSPEQQHQTVLDYLSNTPRSLIIMDDLPEISLLDNPLNSGLIPSTLPCHILFTSRQQIHSRF